MEERRFADTDVIRLRELTYKGAAQLTPKEVEELQDLAVMLLSQVRSYKKAIQISIGDKHA